MNSFGPGPSRATLGRCFSCESEQDDSLLAQIDGNRASSGSSATPTMRCTRRVRAQWRTESVARHALLRPSGCRGEQDQGCGDVYHAWMLRVRIAATTGTPPNGCDARPGCSLADVTRPVDIDRH